MSTATADQIMRSSRKPRRDPWQAVQQSTPVYAAVVEELGFDPTNYPKVSITPTKRDRHNAGKLTGRVWESLLPDGSVDPEKAVPPNVVTTQELPQIKR